MNLTKAFCIAGLWIVAACGAQVTEDPTSDEEIGTSESAMCVDSWSSLDPAYCNEYGFMDCMIACGGSNGIFCSGPMGCFCQCAAGIGESCSSPYCANF